LNKKGFIASYIVDFYAYLIFAAIVAIFFIVMAFAASPVEKELSIKQNSANAMIILIRALQTQIQIDGKITTPAEIISSEDLTHDKEFKEIMGKALTTAYPQKRDIEDIWLSVYPKDSVPPSLCKAQPTTTFAYGHRGNDPSARSAVYTIVNIPLKNKIDAMTVLLCIGGYYFQ